MKGDNQEELMKRAYVMLLFGFAVLSACGNPAAPPAPAPDATASQSKSSDAEQAFLQTMVPHHEMAIEMAKMAEQKAKSPVIKKMSGEIIRTQSEEIAKMKAIHQRLFNGELKSDMMAHDRLGLSMEEAGMKMDMDMLESARDFDKAFAEQMVMHHQGSINMARKVLEKTQDAEIRSLAEAIIQAQTKEIEVLRGI
jgi:uncharacterized protein (DUF305 family)